MDMWYNLNTNKLKTLFTIYSVIYWGIYIIDAFWNWDLYNPFWWVLELPIDEHLRGNALMIIGLSGFFSICIYHEFLNKYGKFKDPSIKYLN